MFGGMDLENILSNIEIKKDTNELRNTEQKSMNYESTCQYNMDDKENVITQFNSNSNMSGTVKIIQKYEQNSIETFKQNGFNSTAFKKQDKNDINQFEFQSAGKKNKISEKIRNINVKKKILPPLNVQKHYLMRSVDQNGNKKDRFGRSYVSTFKNQNTNVSDVQKQQKVQSFDQSQQNQEEYSSPVNQFNKIEINRDGCDYNQTVGFNRYGNLKRSSSIEKRLEREFDIIKQIGKGNFGKVYKVRNKVDNQIYAVKQQRINANEVIRLAQLSQKQENIVKYYGSWVEDDHMFLQMEYCEQSLQGLMELQFIDEQVLVQMLKEILSALKCIHQQNIVHMDVKPDNILVNQNGKFKLTDLGLARDSFNRNNEDIEEGDCRYLAQEVLTHQSNQSFDFSKADIFSLGISVYQIITGWKLPLNGQQWQNLRSNNFQISSTVYSDQLISIVKKMMEQDCVLRPSAEQLLQMDIFLSKDQKQLKEQIQLNMELQQQVDRLKYQLKDQQYSF